MCMKSLIINELENYLVEAELMVGTDVLKITLSLVRCINKHPFLTLNEKKVVHEGCEERSGRWVMSAANIPSVNPHYPHDHRLRLGHGGLVNEYIIGLLMILIMKKAKPH